MSPPATTLSRAAQSGTQRDQLLAVVALYKALGGGWRDEIKPKLAVK